MKTVDNIMASFAMLECYAGNLKAVGFKQVFMTKAEQEATNRLYEEHAKTATPSLDVYRLNRENAAGVKQADGGYLKFGEEGQRMVCPAQLVADMTKLGYHLVHVHILRREADLDEKQRQRLHFRLYFSKTAPAARFSLTADQQSVAREFFNGSYFKLFGYFNPVSVSLEGDASPIRGSIVTLNFSGVMQGRNLQWSSGEIRDLRMVGENHFRCIPRDPEKSQDADWHTGEDLSTGAVVDRAFAQSEPRTICPNRPSAF